MKKSVKCNFFAENLVIVITFQIKTTDYGDFQLKKMLYLSTISKLLL
jgi:hypothetical protein